MQGGAEGAWVVIVYHKSQTNMFMCYILKTEWSLLLVNMQGSLHYKRDMLLVKIQVTLHCKQGSLYETLI